MQPTGRAYQTIFNKLLIDMILNYIITQLITLSISTVSEIHTHGLVLRCDFILCREELTADYVGKLHGELIPTV